MARELKITPQAIRLANLVPPEAMPFRNLVGKVFDSGDYPNVLRRAEKAIDIAAVRKRQAAGETVGVAASRPFASRARTARRSITLGAFP